MNPPDREALSATIESLAEGRVLCLGDLMLDTFVYGSVDRLSPEAPVPVLNAAYEERMLGGAGNVIRNIAALGAKACLIAAIGDDPTGKVLTRAIAEEVQVEPYLITERDRISTVKTRYISGAQQLLRVDQEKSDPVSEVTEERIFNVLDSVIPEVDVVVLSDYAKGLLTLRVVCGALERAKSSGKPTVVDPKHRDLSRYAGATVITPNLRELMEATSQRLQSDEEIIDAARALAKQHDFANVLVTRSRRGMTLVPREGEVSHFNAVTQEVFDVSGAGDTVVACVALGIAAGLPLKDAAYIANLAAGVVVTRIGTSVVHRTDLKTALLTHDMLSSTRKILPENVALTHIRRWREQGQKIGFTNGCFDLIHPGHVSLMEQAKAACDRLVVGLNSDDSVRRLKGSTRPVQSEMARAMVLASLEPVDAIVIFREDTPEKLIEAVRPDVLVKGADYTVDEVVGGAFVQSYGGQVVLAKLSEGMSTSNLIRRANS
ncbi:MAG: D-glycero-beta-D-manno-heptose-7-phosphate kinase [Hyphomicrobiales bacterium]|nr:D-glycero-beta-D-manno-heptose-7-phosphate kinase [Rickettsiales bacterium]MCP5361547.1 D-glycero-beta-D-manno-heptose-7-phosphate kinase [Hyphomicrobiales bacterium]